MCFTSVNWTVLCRYQWPWINLISMLLLFVIIIIPKHSKKDWLMDVGCWSQPDPCSLQLVLQIHLSSSASQCVWMCKSTNNNFQIVLGLHRWHHGNRKKMKWILPVAGLRIENVFTEHKKLFSTNNELDITMACFLCIFTSYMKGLKPQWGRYYVSK